ncbi:MAG: radical SAM protein [Candidatus Lokiarchaeota archaeon]|nr:radical SAM protein [Candidatus Lokiarchaeota archaeon]
MEASTFELKVEVLFKGFKLKVDPGHLGNDTGTSAAIDLVSRKGGAGPAGGMFVQYKDMFLANVPMQEQMTRGSDLVIDKVPLSGSFDVFKESAGGGLDPYAQFLKVPAPSFYDDLYIPKELTSIGEAIPYRKIALVHGIDCIATTINQSCKYWRCGAQCDFCAIEESVKAGQTMAKKDPDALVAFTEKARAEKRVKHFTLTSGTQEGPDGGALEYIPFVEALKRNFKYPVHVQAAPVHETEYLDKLYYAGVDNIGIHVETFPEANRRLHTPGKSKIPIKTYEKNWDYAVSLFGENQVESYLLVGLGETLEEFKAAVDLVVDHGVIPLVVPARSIENTRFNQNRLKGHQDLVHRYIHAAKRMREQGLRAEKALAGCVRCGACSAILEATKVAQQYP